MPARDHDDEDAAPPSKRGRYDSTDDVDDVDIAAGIRADIMRLGEQVGGLPTCMAWRHTTQILVHLTRSLTPHNLHSHSWCSLTTHALELSVARVAPVNVCALLAISQKAHIAHIHTVTMTLSPRVHLLHLEEYTCNLVNMSQWILCFMFIRQLVASSHVYSF